MKKISDEEKRVKKEIAIDIAEKEGEIKVKKDIIEEDKSESIKETVVGQVTGDMIVNIEEMTIEMIPNITRAQGRKGEVLGKEMIIQGELEV